MDIYNEYHLFESKIDSEDIETLVAVCQYMKIPVKMIYSSSFMYYKYYYLLENSQKPILMSACIGLACKLLDNVINYKDIISCVKKKVSFAEDITEAVLNMELEILVITRFDISLSDLYAYTQVVCLKYCLKKSICRKAWVLLNDSMHLPLIIFFNSKLLVNSIVVLACKLENEEIDLKHEIFIIERMVMLYENRSK